MMMGKGVVVKQLCISIVVVVGKLTYTFHRIAPHSQISLECGFALFFGLGLWF